MNAMQALCLDSAGARLRECAAPVAGAGEALVRVRMAGICNTDLEIAKGYMGFRGVLGHELCGEVVAHPDRAAVGQRVAGEINLACGACSMCARGLGRHCPTRSVLGILGKDGCFAELVTLPVVNLHPLPPALPDELACFVEPAAAAFEIAEQVDLSAHAHAVVLGDGKLGLLVAQVLAAAGCEPIVVGHHARKLALARSLGICTRSLDELPAKQCDLVVEATGSPEGMRAAIALTRPRGTIVLKSTYHGVLALDAAPLVIDELTLVGSRCGPFAPAIAALVSGAVDPRGLIDDVLPLARAEQALARAAEPGALKILLDCRAGTRPA